jgi:hypothetical protein
MALYYLIGIYFFYFFYFVFFIFFIFYFLFFIILFFVFCFLFFVFFYLFVTCLLHVCYLFVTCLLPVTCLPIFVIFFFVIRELSPRHSTSGNILCRFGFSLGHAVALVDHLVCTHRRLWLWFVYR